MWGGSDCCGLSWGVNDGGSGDGDGVGEMWTRRGGSGVAILGVGGREKGYLYDEVFSLGSFEVVAAFDCLLWMVRVPEEDLPRVC